MKFEELGVVVNTVGVQSEFEKNDAFKDFVLNCLLVRYVNEDWGDLDAEDKALNDAAVKNGDDRILASYRIPDDVGYDIDAEKIWIITEWDRSATTILFPSEY